MNHKDLLRRMSGLVVIVLLLAACGGAPDKPAAPKPVSNPKAGQWQGESAHFIVTEDGKVRGLNITTKQTISMQKCNFAFEKDLPIQEGGIELRQELQSQTVFTITLEFKSETTASVSYSATFCPNPAGVWFGPPQEGTYPVTWQAKP